MSETTARLVSPDRSPSAGVVSRKSFALLPILLVIAIAAIVPRAAAWKFRLGPADGDERHYIGLAEGLVREGRLTQERGGAIEDHYGPLYPLLGAGVVAAGVPAEPAMRGVSMLAGTLAAVLAAWLALRFWGAAGGALAGLLAALHPMAVLSSVQVSPEALFSALVVAAILSLDRSRAPKGLFALFVALASLVRREAAVLLPAGLLFDALRLRWSGSRPGRGWWSEAAAAVALFAVLFLPFPILVHSATGRWTLSGKGDFVFFLGRAMEGKSTSLVTNAEYRALRDRYEGVGDYVRQHPMSTAAALARTTGYHLRTLFFGRRSLPFGLAAVAGLVVALASRRLDRRRTLLLALPIVLLPVWAVAGPVARYSRNLLPFVAVLGGALPLVFAGGLRRTERSAGG
jgi:4-amino-4-deoxy-L-arabinose transferase-like glycosyltransferase